MEGSEEREENLDEFIKTKNELINKLKKENKSEERIKIQESLIIAENNIEKYKSILEEKNNQNKYDNKKE